MAEAVRRSRAGSAAVAALGLAALGTLAFVERARLPLDEVAHWWTGAAVEPPPVSSAPPPALRAIAALGRIEPKDGVRRVAGPATPVAVVEKLLVDKGDRVHAGDVIAVMEGAEIRQAAVARARARAAAAQAELRRNLELHADELISDSTRDALQLEADVSKAELHAAEAELERTKVRAPIDGQVVDVHARDGERVGPDGIVEIGETGKMYAVAEVYESDIRRVKLGQTAEVTSAALARPLHGEVERIGYKVGKLDALGTDPAARTDARVVEVEIRLDEPDAAIASALTHLQVEVEIQR